MIEMIAAVSRNLVIGNENGELPWVIPTDLKHFKENTIDKTIVMGRKTWESIGSKPLPNRTNVIITRNLGFKPPRGVHVIHDIMDIFSFQKPVIIGGGQLYKSTLPMVDLLHLTEVDIEINEPNTVYFPRYGRIFKHKTCSRWQEENGYKFRFCELVK